MRRVALVVAGLSAAGVLVGTAAGSGELPRLPTQIGSPGLAVRPPVVSFTGGSSGFLGGFDGAPRASSKVGWNNFGHFTWSSWTARDARGSGAAWLRTCWRPGCAKHWFTPYHATAHASRPVHGHFTRLAIVVTIDGRQMVDCRSVAYIGPPESYYSYGSSFHCRP